MNGMLFLNRCENDIPAPSIAHSAALHHISKNETQCKMSNKPTKFTNERAIDRASEWANEQASERTNGLFGCQNRDIENSHRLFSNNGTKAITTITHRNTHQSSENHVHTNRSMHGNHLSKSDRTNERKKQIYRSVQPSLGSISLLFMFLKKNTECL